MELSALEAPVDGSRTPHRTVDISVIIVSWNTRDILRGCLASVFAGQGDLSIEVFVVDNNSADGTAEMIRAEFPTVVLIANTDSRGFAAANNQAIPQARGRYLLLLNPDTRVEADSLGSVVTVADTATDTAVVGCRVMMDEHRRQDTCFRFPGPLNLLLVTIGAHRWGRRWPFFGRAEYGGWQRDTERRVDVVTGMFMLVRREAVQQVGLMDEDYFVYGEESDWCYRFRKAGWHNLFTPAAQIVHLDGGAQSTRQIRTKMFVQLQKSLLLFNRKNLGWPAYALAKCVLTSSMLLRGSLWGVVALLTRSTKARNKAQCAGAALKFHLFGVDPMAKAVPQASELEPQSR